jgi:hypothetical protein
MVPITSNLFAVPVSSINSDEMKKCIILLILVLPFVASGQLGTTLSVSKLSATLNEWNRAGMITYIVDQQSIDPKQVVIKAEIKTTDGTVVATKDLTKAQVFTLAKGSHVFFGKDVVPMEIMMFTGSYRSTLEKTGKLPAGTYQLEVRLVEPGTFVPLSPLQIRVFTLMAPQLPYLMKPVNNDTLDARQSETAIIFRWTNLAPATMGLPFYRLQVFEILPDQQPMQALRGNQPVLDQLLKGQTQFIWRPQMSFTTDTVGNRFIWTIQTLDAQGQPYVLSSSNGESRSEPSMFFIRPKRNN